jgi:hypothetical protein
VGIGLVITVLPKSRRGPTGHLADETDEVGLGWPAVFARTWLVLPRSRQSSANTAIYLYHNTGNQSSELNISINSSSYVIIAKRYAIALMVKATVHICTTAAIVDSIAVADVQAQLGAVSPDGMLDEPGENGGKLGVEGAGINTLRDCF